jgi:hypothetical protein
MTVFNQHGPLSSLTFNVPLHRSPSIEGKPAAKRLKLNKQVVELATGGGTSTAVEDFSDKMEVDPSVEELLQVCIPQFLVEI